MRGVLEPEHGEQRSPGDGIPPEVGDRLSEGGSPRHLFSCFWFWMFQIFWFACPGRSSQIFWSSVVHDVVRVIFQEYGGDVEAMVVAGSMELVMAMS